MTKRFCHAGLCMALVFAASFGSARAGDATAPQVSHRDTHRTRIVRAALQSSVNIHTEKRQKSIDVVFSAGKAAKINGMGTGIVVDERGYIVTNFHVVQDVERLRVTTDSGAQYDARVLTFDSREDLAIIKIEPREPMTVATFGTSSDLMVGEDVIAIGNAYGYEDTITLGIISHKSRDVEVNDEQSYHNLIQIDAAINPGNSGGPLINADGEVVGINVAIRAGAQRIGFAIPVDNARQVIAKLINIEHHYQTYHGIAASDVKNGQDRKLVVQAVNADSPANVAGLKPGDVIVKSAGVNVVDSADLERSLFGKICGSEIPLIVMRNGESMAFSFKLGELSAARRQPGKQTLVSMEKPKPATTNSLGDRTWDVFGLRLEPMNGKFPDPKQPYRGGMRVSAVRPQSPAESNGIRVGDILVGLHVWETVSNENIEYVLNHPELNTLTPLKFYIVRNGETLFGHFRLMLAQK